MSEHAGGVFGMRSTIPGVDPHTVDDDVSQDVELPAQRLNAPPHGLTPRSMSLRDDPLDNAGADTDSCVYRKLELGLNGREVHAGWRVN